MQIEKTEAFADLLGINPESAAFALIEGTADALPYIGKVYNAFKMNRLQQRVKRVESRLQKLSSSMIESGDELLNEFIRKKAFPLTLDELLEEHEEEKIDLIINGLDYVYKQEIREESKMLVYFDVLRELRVEEIKKLIKFSDEYKKLGIRPKIDLGFAPEDIEERNKFYENRSYTTYIDNHLEKLGLLDTGLRSIQETIDEFNSQLNDTLQYSRKRPRKISSEPTLTPFGKYFIKFFELSQLIELPAD